LAPLHIERVLAPKPPKVIHRKSNKTRIFRGFAANRLILGRTKLPRFRGSKATKTWLLAWTQVAQTVWPKAQFN
jgi:hypothetical protein